MLWIPEMKSYSPLMDCAGGRHFRGGYLKISAHKTATICVSGYDQRDVRKCVFFVIWVNWSFEDDYLVWCWYIWGSMRCNEYVVSTFSLQVTLYEAVPYVYVSSLPLSLCHCSVHAPVTVATVCVRCVVSLTTFPQATSVTPVWPQRAEKSATNNPVELR